MCRPRLGPAARLVLVALLAGCATVNPQAT
jgi:hypothetical protein